jgi:hypothetical protein
VIQVGNGATTLFRTDNWLSGESIKNLVSVLSSLVSPRVKKVRTVLQALPDRSWVQDISGRLTVEAIIEYLTLWDRLEGVQLHLDQEDVVHWTGSPDGRYSAQSAYQLLHRQLPRRPEARLIWKSWAPLRVKLFMWLACHGRIWTADRGRRRNLEAHEYCLLCDQLLESADNLLVTCPVAKEIYWLAFTWARCSCTFGAALTLRDWWEQLLTAQAPRRKKGAASLFILVAWFIWKEHKARMFDQRPASVFVILDKNQGGDPALDCCGRT